MALFLVALLYAPALATNEAIQTQPNASGQIVTHQDLNMYPESMRNETGLLSTAIVGAQNVLPATNPLSITPSGSAMTFTVGGTGQMVIAQDSAPGGSGNARIIDSCQVQTITIPSNSTGSARTDLLSLQYVQSQASPHSVPFSNGIVQTVYNSLESCRYNYATGTTTPPSGYVAFARITVPNAATNAAQATISYQFPTVRSSLYSVLGGMVTSVNGLQGAVTMMDLTSVQTAAGAKTFTAPLKGLSSISAGNSNVATGITGDSVLASGTAGQDNVREIEIGCALGSFGACVFGTDSTRSVGGVSGSGLCFYVLGASCQVTFDGAGNIGATAFKTGSSVYGPTSAAVAGQVSAGSHVLASQGGPSGAGYSFSGDTGADTGMFSLGDGDLELYANNLDALTITTSMVRANEALSATNHILAPQGAPSNAGYSFTGDTGADTGMFSPSDGDLELYADNLDAISITASAITAHEPISAPSLSLTTALAKGSGGTGTASPATTAGPGIDISGSWPNQTFSTTTQIISGTCISGGGSTCTISTANQILGALCNVQQGSPYANADLCFIDSAASNYTHGSLVIASAQVTGVGGQSAGTGAGVGMAYTLFVNNTPHL
jgi:hypothetical protein